MAGLGGGSSAGRAPRSQCGGREFDPPPLHQKLTPNPSRLGVSISASRKPRGVRAYSACAGGVHGLGRRAAGLTLFCPLFSQNLHQLFRRGTRRLRCSSNTYARAMGSGLLACLHEQNCRASNRKLARPTPESSLGRKRIVAVAVALTDLPVSSLDEQLTLLVDGDAPCAANRLSLRIMDRCDAFVTFSPHTPLITAIDGYNPLNISGHYKYST